MDNYKAPIVPGVLKSLVGSHLVGWLVGWVVGWLVGGGIHVVSACVCVFTLLYVILHTVACSLHKKCIFQEIRVVYTQYADPWKELHLE